MSAREHAGTLTFREDVTPVYVCPRCNSPMTVLWDEPTPATRRGRCLNCLARLHVSSAHVISVVAEPY